MLIQRTGGAAQHILGGGITLRSAGGGAVRTYATILRDDYAASEVWPLVNIASGTTVSAFINSARNGTLTGLTLQNTAGPVTGTLAPLFDGTNDHVNIYSSNGSTGMADIWNGNIGGFFCWCMVSGAGVWTDGTNDEIAIALASANNNFTLRKITTSNSINYFYDTTTAGSTSITTTFSGTGWFSVSLTWDNTVPAVKAYLNGAQVGVTDTDAFTWVGALSSTRTLIGANQTTPTNPWNGWLAYPTYRFGSTWSVADIAAMHAAAATAGPDV